MIQASNIGVVLGFLEHVDECLDVMRLYERQQFNIVPDEADKELNRNGINCVEK